jgi:hypothetical protein
MSVPLCSLPLLALAWQPGDDGDSGQERTTNSVRRTTGVVLGLIRRLSTALAQRTPYRTSHQRDRERIVGQRSAS